MKKVLFLVFSLFAFVFVCNAKESWEWKEFTFSEDFGMTDIYYFGYDNMFNSVITKSEKGIFIALGNEYECQDSTTPGESTHICNVYYIDIDGKVSKANAYYDNTYEDFPGYYYYALIPELNQFDPELNGYSETFKLRITQSHKTSVRYKGDSLASTMPVYYVKDNDGNDILFNHFECNQTNTDYISYACEVGVVKGDQTLYGVISSSGEFIIEPNAKYSLVFSNEEERPNFIALQDEENYYIVSDNLHIEVLSKSFLSENQIDIKQVFIEKSSTFTNYYNAPGIIDDDIATGLFPSRIFAGRVISNFGFDAKPVYSTTLLLLWSEPYFIDGHNATSSQDSEMIYNVYSWKGYNDKIYEDITNPVIGSYLHGIEDVFGYDKGGKFYVTTDMKNNIAVHTYRENTANMKLVADGGYDDIYLFKESLSSSVTNPGFKLKYYILINNEEIEEPDPEPTPTPDPSKTPKYSCQKAEGYFWDKNGNKVTKEEYENACPEKVPDTGFVTPVVSVISLASGFVVFKKKKLLNRI